MRSPVSVAAPSLSLLVAGSSLSLGAGCGGATPPPATPPSQPPPTPPASVTAPPPSTPPPAAKADPFATPANLRREAPPSLPTQSPEDEIAARAEKTAGVRAPDATCAVYTKRAVAAPEASCKDGPAARAALEKALAIADAAKRDAALGALEACKGLPRGFVRGLRAELAPAACGDVLVKDERKNLASYDPVVAHALVGYFVAGRLARTPSAPPAMTGAATRERVQAFVSGPFKQWFADQARALEELSNVGVKLGFYGRAVVAVEAGLAEIRFVETVRAAPIPAAWQADPELRVVYYGALDQMLEPRKARMRDALLVGLRDMAAVGVIHDARVDRARTGLSGLYAGRRIDALDGLMLGDDDAAGGGLFAALPTFYAGLLLSPDEAKDPRVVPQLARRGLPWSLRLGLASAPIADKGQRAAYARARLDLGRTHWRAADYDAALGLLLEDAAALDEPSRLVAAAALALREGPDDAHAMMNAASPSALNLRKVDALDAVAGGKGEVAGRADYDAALLALLSPPEGAGKAHFTALAERFRRAASKLVKPDEKKRAEEAAARAEATARAL
jgi:hypothetical protein